MIDLIRSESFGRCQDSVPVMARSKKPTRPFNMEVRLICGFGHEFL
jgi:hypothetical protein